MAAVAAISPSPGSSMCAASNEEFFANVNALIQQQQQYQQHQLQQQQLHQQLQEHPAFSKQIYRELSPFRTMVAQAAEEPESELRTTRPPVHSSDSPKNARLAVEKKPKMNSLDVAEAEELATRIRPWELKILIEIYRTRARRNIRIKISNAYCMLYGTSKENTKNFYKLLRGERHRGEPLVLLLLWIKLAYPSPTVCCSLIDAILSTMQER